MANNKLSDLNKHLFAQMERLSLAGITADQLDAEVKRTQSIIAVSDQIISNAELQLKAAKLFAEHGANVLDMLPQIGKASE
ncbi:MAG: hypothetical protein ACOH2H_15235 [Cypionkella sp.]